MVLGQSGPSLSPSPSLVCVEEVAKVLDPGQFHFRVIAGLDSAFSCPRVLESEGVLPPCHASAAVVFTHHSRFIKILDSVLHHLVPAWDHTLGTFSEIKVSPTQAMLVFAVGISFLLRQLFILHQSVLGPPPGLDLCWALGT